MVAGDDDQTVTSGANGIEHGIEQLLLRCFILGGAAGEREVAAENNKVDIREFGSDLLAVADVSDQGVANDGASKVRALLVPVREVKPGNVLHGFLLGGLRAESPRCCGCLVVKYSRYDPCQVKHRTFERARDISLRNSSDVKPITQTSCSGVIFRSIPRSVD